jgi:phospholipase C
MLEQIQHVVVLMLENRSFDHMLGLLYRDRQNVSLAGQPFEGLTGHETNLDAHGTSVAAFAIDHTQPLAYFMPGADPGEGYQQTNMQLFGALSAPSAPVATNAGFVKDFDSTISWDKNNHRSVLAGTVAKNIMGMFPPAMLPVLSGLARGYAVCDHWFSSAPTETMPNRAFVCAATSQGHLDDKTKSFTAPSIFGLLGQHGLAWAIYGYDQEPLTRLDFPDTIAASDDHFGLFKDFQDAAQKGTLGAYTFLEPSWSSTGNSQHPNYDVALGEQLIHDVYYALRNGPGWNATLLIITYDEHGGCYDHVPPPQGAVTPDAAVGEFGFDFKRFGVRVPTVLVSPRIAQGTVLRAAAGKTPFDHTSILKTVETRWKLPALTARDKAAPDVGSIVTLATPRTDDPLEGVVVPVSKTASPHSDADPPSHLQEIHADLVAALPVPDAKGVTQHVMPALKTGADYASYIRTRTAEWKASRARAAAPRQPARGR